MEGFKFDTEILKRGLPVRWITSGLSGNRFGLIVRVDEKTIDILAVDANHELEFLTKKYHISQIRELEVLGSWEE